MRKPPQAVQDQGVAARKTAILNILPSLSSLPTVLVDKQGYRRLRRQ